MFLVNTMSNPKGGVVGNKKEIELEIKKYQTSIKKQDKLFCCMRLLLITISVFQYPVQFS